MAITLVFFSALLGVFLENVGNDSKVSKHLKHQPTIL